LPTVKRYSSWRDCLARCRICFLPGNAGQSLQHDRAGK
jgi:hypothetical protein